MFNTKDNKKNVKNNKPLTLTPLKAASFEEFHDLDELFDMGHSQASLKENKALEQAKNLLAGKRNQQSAVLNKVKEFKKEISRIQAQIVLNRELREDDIAVKEASEKSLNDIQSHELYHQKDALEGALGRAKIKLKEKEEWYNGKLSCAVDGGVTLAGGVAGAYYGPGIWAATKGATKFVAGGVTGMAGAVAGHLIYKGLWDTFSLDEAREERDRAELELNAAKEQVVDLEGQQDTLNELERKVMLLEGRIVEKADQINSYKEQISTLKARKRELKEALEKLNNDSESEKNIPNSKSQDSSNPYRTFASKTSGKEKLIEGEVLKYPTKSSVLK